MESINGNVTDILSGIMAAAAETNRPQDGDYIGDDGLIYCGKCHTSKQCKHIFCGREVISPCVCDCAKARHEAENARLEQEQRILMTERYRDEAFLPGSVYRNARFENAEDTPIIRAAREYVRRFDESEPGEKKGLMLYGTTGAGKTYAAACIANALIDNGLSVVMTTMSRIANKLQSSFEGKNEYLDKLASVSLLILDDFYAERQTEFMAETTFEVINARCEARKPLIITTNMSRTDIQNARNDIKSNRLMSRIVDNCHLIECIGDDRRVQAARADHEYYKALYGV